MPRTAAIAACIALAGGAAVAASGPGCSSESHLVGNGACDAFCAKVSGAQCRVPTTRESCLDECLWYQRDCGGRPSCLVSACGEHQNDFLRCVTVDGNVLCDLATGAPKPVGCDYLARERDAHCQLYVPDAGPPFAAAR